MFKSKANYPKLKTNLRLCVQRLKFLEKKKSELALKSRKEISEYILAGKEDRARIRVEHIIREDYLVEALEILELFCDLLLTRFGMIETMATMDNGLREPIASLLWSCPRLQVDIPEFRQISKQLTAKFSPEFAEMCRKNEDKEVNAKLEHKLSVHAPPRILVERYMIEIAKSYNVPFEPDQEAMNDDSDIPISSLIDLSAVDSNYGGNNYGHPPLAPMYAQQHDSKGQMPPPLPSMAPDSMYPPPADMSMPQPPGLPYPAMGPNAAYPPPPGEVTIPSLPAYNGATAQTPPPAYTPTPPRSNPGPGPGSAPSIKDLLPNLPNVPTPSASFNIGASAGGEDVDFDDLTRRFEELKKKK